MVEVTAIRLQSSRASVLPAPLCWAMNAKARIMQPLKFGVRILRSDAKAASKGATRVVSCSIHFNWIPQLRITKRFALYRHYFRENPINFSQEKPYSFEQRQRISYQKISDIISSSKMKLVIGSKNPVKNSLPLGKVKRKHVKMNLLRQQNV